MNLNISSEYVYFVIEKKEEVKLYKTDLNFEELEEVYMDVRIDKSMKIVFLDVYAAQIIPLRRSSQSHHIGR